MVLECWAIAVRVTSVGCSEVTSGGVTVSCERNVICKSILQMSKMGRLNEIISELS